MLCPKPDAPPPAGANPANVLQLSRFGRRTRRGVVWLSSICRLMSFGRTAAAQEPPDFDAFWAETLDAARQHPLDARFEPVGLRAAPGGHLRCYFRCGYGGQPVKDWLVLPVGQAGAALRRRVHRLWGAGAASHEWLTFPLLASPTWSWTRAGRASWRQVIRPTCPKATTRTRPAS